MARHSFTGLGTFPIVVFFVMVAAEIGTPAPIEAADNSTVIVANCPLELTANLDLLSNYSKRTAEGIRGAAEMFADSDENLDFEYMQCDRDDAREYFLGPSLHGLPTSNMSTETLVMYIVLLGRIYNEKNFNASDFVNDLMDFLDEALRTMTLLKYCKLLPMNEEVFKNSYREDTLKDQILKTVCIVYGDLVDVECPNTCLDHCS